MCKLVDLKLDNGKSISVADIKVPFIQNILNSIKLQMIQKLNQS